MPIKASAPGSLMILGEYGVLQGELALICSINQRISVTLTPRTDHRIELLSTYYGQYWMNQAQLRQESAHSHPPCWHFIFSILKRYQSYFNTGFQLDIESDFSGEWGLGSSTALIVATIMVVMAWIHPNDRILQEHLHAEAHALQCAAQGGIGSGADVAASVYGGLLAYRASPLMLKKYSTLYSLSVVYSGFKTKTSVAVQHVKANFKSNPLFLNQLCHEIGQCATRGIAFIEQAPVNWLQLGVTMNQQQLLLEQLGVSLPLLNQIQAALLQQPMILGAKISGSGLGDCVIGLGEASANAMKQALEAFVGADRVQYPVIRMHEEGARYEQT